MSNSRGVAVTGPTLPDRHQAPRSAQPTQIEECRARGPAFLYTCDGWAVGFNGFDQPRRPHTGHARIPCECSTFSATRICSSRLAPLGEPEPPLACQVPDVNCRPPA